MDPRQFDSLVRKLGLAVTRRGALTTVLAGLIAPTLPDAVEANRKKGRGQSGRGRNKGKAGGRGKGRGHKKTAAEANAQQGGACRRAGHPCEGNQRCCDGLVCIVSGPGAARRCTPCGGAGEPCCAADDCGNELACRDGECVDCGAAGHPCCDGDACDGRTTCEDGSCVACGGADQGCCAGNDCDDGFNCDEGSCVACGDDTLACCDEGEPCGGGLVCNDDGECEACGSGGDLCCADETCDDGFNCDAGSCVACGGAGDACCDAGPECGGDLVCDDDGVCGSPCGGAGNACCADGSCGENLVCNEGTCAASCDIGDVVCVIGGHGQCVPGVCCEEGDGPSCGDGLTCIAGGCIDADQFRIVLRWGAEPRDLDSHLWLPLATPSHIAWDHKGTVAAFPFAELDIDDITGFGPETITIAELQVGTYLYAVHHYAGDGTIGTSGATVEVYHGPTLVKTYHVPVNDPWQTQDPAQPPYNGRTIWWKVFQLDYDGVNPAVITDFNAASTDPRPYMTDNPVSRSSGASTHLKSEVAGGNTAPRRSRKARNRRRARR